MSTKTDHNGSCILAAVIVIALFAIIFGSLSAAQRANTKRTCENNGQVYVDSSNTCRDKTISEQFSEQCIDGIDIGTNHYSCRDLRNSGLEEAYINNKTIVRHGNNIYEKGTALEVAAGKRVGDYCLSASDTWSHVGEARCVAFTPTYFVRKGFNFFLDEKQDYLNGFTVYMYGNYNWDWFIDTYKDKGEILVCGVITLYQGHPQIKTIPSSTMVSPEKTMDGSYVVYNYSCK